MVDRLDILNVAAQKVSLPATKSAQYVKQLDRAVALVLSELSLEDARQCSLSDRKNLERALHEIVNVGDLKKISKKWEPKRKIDTATTQTELANALIELLHQRRKSYMELSLPLEQARTLSTEKKSEVADQIERLAPLTDLKKLARKWDKHNKSLHNSSRKEITKGLLSLLNSTSEPFPPPPKKSTRKK